MRIAWQNLAKTNATIAAPTEDSNYPVENLYHKWKLKRFQSTNTGAVLTITWSADISVSCIGIAYHNLSGCSVVLKNSADATLDTWTVPITYQTDLYVDTELTTVRSIVITMTSASTLYLGGLFVGSYIEIDKEAGQDIPLSDTSNMTKSIGGQVAGRLGVTLRSGSITVPDLTVTQRKAFESMQEDLQKIYPFWLDLWHSSHASFEPFYGHLTSGMGITKDNWQNTTVNFSIEEAN